jgi:serine/threonine-protein kinase
VVDALIDREFAGYRILERIGRGGMGVVYRATDLSLDRTVALKVLAGPVASDPEFQRRFVSESKLAASLDHPHVIPIFGAGEADGTLFIAMRFVEGSDLRTIVRGEGALAPERAVWIVSQLASALDAAHAHGLVHRDVKPGNVLLAEDDHVYLTDFGLSKRLVADADETRTGMVLGTLDYLAPEQIRHEPLGPWTDIYSLGCLSYHLISGEVPFPLDTEEAKLWAHVSESPPGTGTPFDGGLRRAMAKRPQDRFKTPGELALALQKAATQGTPAKRRHVPAVHAPRRPATPRVRRDVLVRSLLDPFNLVLLVALIAIGFALGTVAVMVPLAVLVYLAGVVRSYRDPATARRTRR